MHSGVGELSYGLTRLARGRRGLAKAAPWRISARQWGFFVAPTPRLQDEVAARPPHRNSLPCLRSTRRCGRQREEPAENDFDATPLGWATHGSEHGWHRRTGNYPAIVAALLEAGAMLLETASGADPVKEVLHRHGSKGGIA